MLVPEECTRDIPIEAERPDESAPADDVGVFLACALKLLRSERRNPKGVSLVAAGPAVEDPVVAPAVGAFEGSEELALPRLLSLTAASVSS